MSGKHPRTNLPFAASAVPQFRWQLTSGGPVPAPASAAAAVRAPRGSAAAAKRRSASDPTAVAAARHALLAGAPSGDSLQRCWAHPDFLQRAWARPSASAAAATATAVAALLEAANSPAPPPPPKRLCVARNADTLLPMETISAYDSARLDGDAEEPCAKFRRTQVESVSGAGQHSKTTPGAADDTVPPPATPALPRKSLRPVASDAPPAKFPRPANHPGSASDHLRSTVVSSATSASGSATCAAVALSSHPVEPCSTATLAPALRHEVASSSTAPLQTSDLPRPGTPPQRVACAPIHCQARCKSVSTREDLLRQLSSPAVPTSVSSCTVSSSQPRLSALHPVQPKRLRESHFPKDPVFPAKRVRPSSSSSLGEFAAFFK